MILYGIKTCDTVRKALKWLKANNHLVEFHDFREQGLQQETLELWVKQCGWEQVFNKRSTSFRALEPHEKEALDENKAIKLMLQHPTLVKRPVLVNQDQIFIGFKDASYSEWLK
ncbi:arsenate reductase [Shewanella gelidii]|uniref:Arsenate reductase n=1 Tax=Shewanella gelidii TaxID=1642821 RepID=A0A917JUA8_9GAMM|nr:arsenate reductase [Shewanella gelidii]MCL1098580.1 arsenate reductase [Shewanella gelidii]GGI86940.1 arsenate reductase [Shewanella gelidii]